jgi:hypothetical protein
MDRERDLTEGDTEILYLITLTVASAGSSSRTNVWTWDTCVFTLINPSGEKVELNSLHINDFTLGHIREDLEKYVEETHKGVLE